MEVNIFCNWWGTSGYANHSRGLAKAMNDLCDVRITTPLPAGWERNVDDTEFRMLTKPDTPERINIIIDLPHRWPMYLDKKHNVGFLVWEGDKIPESWVENLKDPRISLIFVPSEHVRTAIKNTTKDMKIIKKIKIVPHGADRLKFYPEPTQSERFNFICNKGFRNKHDRGGMQHAVKAYIEEFQNEDVNLFLKVNPAYGMSQEQINEFLKSAGYNNKPLISISTVDVTQDQLRKLYNEPGVFLNPTEGEAFSLPCLEAMSCGKAVITTAFGGQTDYVTNQNGWLIPYDLHEVKHEIAYEGIQWATPRFADLKKAMREAYENPELLNQKSERALTDTKDLTWMNSAKKAIEYLNDL